MSGSILPLERIVAPTDFSDPSYVALGAAEELARHFSAELIVVHVIDPVPPLVHGPGLPARAGPAVGFDVVGYQRLLQEAAGERLGEVARQRLSPEIRQRAIVKAGPPAETIAMCAEAERADLIVIATHGRTGVRRLLFGSVAEKVVRTAGCPVLTIQGGEEGGTEDR